MQNFNRLTKKLKNDFSALKKLNIAILGDSATQLLVQAIRATGFDYGYNLQVWEADFNQIERQVLDSSSDFYKSEPEIVFLLLSSHKLLDKYNKLEPIQYETLAEMQMDLVHQLYSTIKNHLNAKVICCNFPEINDSVYGSYANKTEASFLFQIRKLNYELMLLAKKHPDFFICDISSVQNYMGRNKLFQASMYINTDMVLSVDVLPEVAKITLDIISTLDGNFKKCLILDLDDTLWGGVIGDDGIENIELGSLGIGKAFTEFQYWIKKLKNRGIIICVCSKNSETIAKEAFENHPDMILRPDDIAVFIANWENKADNIRNIQNILNIGFDSMVFLDNNPFERNLVKENIPEICVPELPEDPADYLEFLYSLNLFETASLSGEDAERTKNYQIEYQRSNFKKTFTGEDDFLKSLNMISSVQTFNKFSIPRVAQLSQRSNQFNLRTVRYTEADIKRFSVSETHLTFTFSLEDKFGDNGLICIIILKKDEGSTLFIDTWLMSCRILKRGMEHFVMNTIVNEAKEKGFDYLKGEYIQTAKNEMVKDHYKNLGFAEHDNFWILNTSGYKNKKCFIHKK